MSGTFHPVAKTAKFPKIEEFKRLRRNRDGNTWLTNGIHWLIGTLISPVWTLDGPRMVDPNMVQSPSFGFLVFGVRSS